MQHAAFVGTQRHLFAMKKRLENSADLTYDDDAGWTIDIEGAAAEKALAKHYGVYWGGTVGKLDEDDVGQYQVRCTRHAGGHLILKKTDKPAKPYILLTGLAPTFCVRGWITGRDGLQSQYWKEHEGRWGYWIPQSLLRPISELEPIIRSQPIAMQAAQSATGS